MMRSWGNRSDTIVIDEPFYAFYLERTGRKHPGADEVIARGETDWRKVVEQCGRGLSAPTGKKIFYQKQMTHHLLPEVDREWIVDVTNCFLIRDPREVILSYIKKNPELALEDLGFVQQEKMATRLARDRRHLGKILVRRRGKIDILPAIQAERRHRSRSSARNL